MSKPFDTINKHTLIGKLLQTNIPETIIKSIANYIKGRKAYTTHPYNVNLKLAFPKVASSHPHYLTFTLQTYHHPEYRFRSCPTHMTSPSHTQARVQQKKYIQPYLHKKMPGQNITISHQIQTKQLALCSLQTLRNIPAIWNSIYTTLHYPWQRTQMFMVLP